MLREAGVDVEIHAHNDFGMAVADSLMAVNAGARYVNTTLWGIGERGGQLQGLPLRRRLRGQQYILRRRCAQGT